jgi:hypothetical protein
VPSTEAYTMASRKRKVDASDKTSRKRVKVPGKKRAEPLKIVI